MPLNLPPSLQLFKPQDADAQRFLPPIERSVTQVLTFLRNTFDDAANAGLRILKPVLLKSLGIDNDLSVGGTATANNVTVNQTLTTYNRAQIRAGLDTPTGVKTLLGHFGYTGNTTAGTYYNLGLPYYGTNALMQMPFRGSVMGCSLIIFSNTAMTVQTFITGILPGEYRFDFAVGAGAAAYTSYTLPRGSWTFEGGYNIVCKLYTPVAATNVSFCMSPWIEYAT